MKSKPRILIVDDDEGIRTQMKWALSDEYQVVMAGDRTEALAAFKAGAPAVTLLDLGLPPHPATPQEGLATLSELLTAQVDAKIIIISGQGEKENALKAVGAGAYDFLSKPVNLEELKVILRRCLYLAELERAHSELRDSLKTESFEGILGSSPQMQEVFAGIRKVAKTTAPVLLLGESGTGKELAASAIHHQSLRKDAPFVPINCNAIPENLLESELFGHEKGAFTGANTQRKGLIESAEGGTLFLDEIGELPLPIQVKLLRFLQERRFQRVGGRQEIKSDSRIVTATNADLKSAVAAGTFREDLYFRLAVIVIQLPALRERKGDAVLLANAFLHRFAIQNSKSGATFDADALRAISSYAWPGNVRELQNRVQRGVIMSEGKRLSATDLELASDITDNPTVTLKEAREALEKEMLQAALRRHNGKITGAASELGISRPTFYELMEKLGIENN